MSSVKTWLTKEEVLKDLAKVSGRRVARVDNLDESCLVVGNAPPPVMFEAEDDEMLLQFGEVIHERGVNCGHVPPDLQGITNMLRMVQESDAESDSGDITNATNNSNCVIAISKGSKLNPNVKEFIPKGTLSSHSPSDLSENVPSRNNKTDEETEDVKCKKKSVSCDATSNDLDVNEDLATDLKKKINVTKSDTFEVKKQNNVAIASLLQLYAANNNNKPANTQNLSEPVKLITPGYYENKASQTTELTVTLPKSTSTTPLPKSDPISAPSVSSNEAKSEPLPVSLNYESPVKPKLDPAIKKSIDKVNQWFGEPVQKKAPPVYLGPIAFKRKEPNASKSPSVCDKQEEKHEIKPNQPCEYKPTNYAADLGRKYMERNKAKENQKINAWANLDVILKRKDEMLLKKQQLAQSGDVTNASLC